MKHRVFVAATFIAVVSLPSINWAQENKSVDNGENPLANRYGASPPSDKQLDEHKQLLKKQAKQNRIQAEEMRAHAELAKKEAHHAAELAKVKVNTIFHRIGHPRLMGEIQEQAANYRDADNEEDKSNALNKLNEVVDKCFEDDMKVREQELASIEERLNKLRAQLDRRRAKKQEIVDLQVKVAINDAEGLGFYSEAKGDMFKFRVPAPVVTEFVNTWESSANWNTNASAPSHGAAPGPVPVAAPAPPGPVGTIRVERGELSVGPPAPPSVVKLVETEKGRLTLQPALNFDRRPLKLGDEGDAVRLLQFQLNERLEPSPNLDPDADFGPDTEQAVKDFQKQEGLEVTGVVDETTHKRLELRVRKRAPK